MAGEKRVQRAAPMGVSLIRISTGPFLLTVGNTFLWGYWVGNLGLLGRKKKKNEKDRKMHWILTACFSAVLPTSLYVDS